MRKDYKQMKRTQHFINASRDERQQLIEYLKAEGFHIDERFSEEDLLCSPFPVAVNMDEKALSILGGAAIAGAAAASDVILTVEEFYEIYK